MTTRRQFCKNLCAAGLMPATLTSFAKFYCGMDFGSGGSTTVWHKIIPSNVYLHGGCYSGYRQMRNYWHWALGQVSAGVLRQGKFNRKGEKVTKYEKRFTKTGERLEVVGN